MNPLVKSLCYLNSEEEMPLIWARPDFHLAFKMYASILHLVQMCIKGEIKIFNLTEFWLLWKWVQSRGGNGEPKDLLFLLRLHWHSLLTVQFGLRRLLQMMPCSPTWEQPMARWLLLSKISVLMRVWRKVQEWDQPPAVLQPDWACTRPVLSG